MKKIVIAGSSGFIGKQIVDYFKKKGDELILLSRKPQVPHFHFWDPENGQLDPALLEGADVVINLCGESVLGRWNQSKKEAIRESRLVPTRLLCNTILNLKVPPKVFINASAVGYYGDRGEEIVTESSPPGHDFLAKVCVEWEAATQVLSTTQVRVVLTRFGMILGTDGGALKQMTKAFHMGMGGVLGSGKQMMSWMAVDDVCAALDRVINHDAMKGPVNFVVPEAVSNKTFTETLGRVLNKPTLVAVPKFALTMMFGEGADLLLASTHVKPERLLESGYHFIYPDLEQALKKYLLTNTDAC